MALSIKTSEPDRLARSPARLTGDSLTEALTEAHLDATRTTRAASAPGLRHEPGDEGGVGRGVTEVFLSRLRLLQEAEERRAAFVASLEASVEEGRRLGFATFYDVRADVGRAIADVPGRQS